jgi:hypothetical protein
MEMVCARGADCRMKFAVAAERCCMYAGADATKGAVKELT